MKTLRVLLAALLSVSITAPSYAASAIPAASAAAAPGYPALVSSAANGISLRSADTALAGLSALHTAWPSLTTQDERTAAILVLGAVALEPAQARQTLEAAGIDSADIDRIQKAVAKVRAGTQKSGNAEFAGQYDDLKTNSAAILQQASQSPEGFLSPALAATYRALLGNAAADQVAAPAVSGVDYSKWSTDDLLDPAKRPTLKFGQATLPVFAMPVWKKLVAKGQYFSDNISALWNSALDQAAVTGNGRKTAKTPALGEKVDADAIIVAYNFDDMDMAQKIVEKAKAGQKIVFIGDYSNWFPEKLSQTAHGGQHASRTDAMKLLADNIGPNLEVLILKGLGSIGINHNKFTVFTGADGQKLLQSGSFNYTKTSQNNHWEHVIFSQDSERVDFYETYFAWLYRHARTFDENLEPADPTLDPADPVPHDATRRQSLNGVPFPSHAAAPNGDGEDWIVTLLETAKKSIDILMFSPFPTPRMVEAIMKKLSAGVAVRMVGDRGQSARATVLVGLIKAGMGFKNIIGPDAVLYKQPAGEHSKMHNKAIVADGALAKMGDSLNISNNALHHNEENIGFYGGYYAAVMKAVFEWIYSLAKAPSQEMLDKLTELAAQSKPKPGAKG